MKIKPINFTHGGFALELVAETPIETGLLQELFAHGEMTRGNGESLTHNGMSTGFYLGFPRAAE